MRFLILGAAAIAVACAPQQATSREPAAASEAATHPVSGLEVIPLSVTTGDARHEFRVEVAASKAEQSRGLMFRTELGPDEGMVFPYQAPQQLGFWMKNTPLPLDIIFIGEDGRIVNIAAQTTPYSTESVYSDGPALAVLEIPGGRAAELGIEPGDRVEWQAERPAGQR